ncbi:MAG: lysylphosphatidylglycerol synthase transmembrane domain-containing protein [Gemmatimonadetes bacterium]|nr:lysylphosphatidylglycerol synthase transmembrane domain-containing protein [Gemmatimonadota bacterium]
MIRRLFVALSLTGVAVATVFVLRKSGGPEALFVIPLGNHLAALGAMVLEVLLRGTRFVVLGIVMGATVPIMRATMAQLAGDGGAAVTPMRSGSDPAKALILSRDGIRGGHIGALLVGEAVSEAILLPVCGAIMALALNVSLTEILGALLWSAMSLTLVGLAVRLAPSRDSSAPRLLQRLGVTGARWERVVRIAADFRQAASALRRMSWVYLLLLAVATVGHVGARLLTLPALAGSDVAAESLPELLGAGFFLLYGGALIPAPGGAGVIEAVFAEMLGDNLPREQLGALTFWWRFYTSHLFALLGWLVITIPTRRKSPQRTAPEG